ARLLLEDANLLVLDEPTNDLDLETLQALESALADFGGSVLVVTHDRFFLDKVATGLLVFEGYGVVREHVGGYDLYRRSRERERERAREAESGRAAASGERRKKADSTPSDPTRPRRLTYRERRELEGIEAAILEAEARRDELGAEFMN